jgi:hypothetical protein
LNFQNAKIVINQLEVVYKVDIMNGSVAHVNTKSGVSMNVTLDIKQELKNISVIFMKFHERLAGF